MFLMFWVLCNLPEWAKQDTNTHTRTSDSHIRYKVPKETKNKDNTRGGERPLTFISGHLSDDNFAHREVTAMERTSPRSVSYGPSHWPSGWGSEAFVALRKKKSDRWHHSRSCKFASIPNTSFAFSGLTLHTEMRRA